MKRIKSFKIFESYASSVGIFGVNDVDTDDEYIKAYAFAKSGMILTNFYKDFKNWLVYKAYEHILIESEGLSFNDPDLIIKSEEDKIQALVEYPINYSDDGFDYSKEANKMGVTKKVNELISVLAGKLKRCPASDDPNSPQVSKEVTESIEKEINEVLDNIFWPGNMPTLSELKFLDLFSDARRENFGINYALKNSIGKICNKYATMERDIDSLGKKFMGLLNGIAENGIESLRKLELPDVVTETIIQYFSKSEDSFKTADAIRKGNENIYNKIKGLLPNIDTAADLGDLGF
jgi:hypothetical protein